MDKKVKKEVISILVDNQANVLTRISSLFGRRGFNIDSITASTTNDPNLSRITVVCTETEQSLNQIITQTAKLEVVKSICVLDSKDSIYREFLLVKLHAGKEERTAIKEIVDIYRGKIASLSRESLIIELTGDSDKLDAFMDIISCYDIDEICRTGITGISRKPSAPTV